MSISKRIRHRLVTVILLGVITSALSLVALVRVISSTTGQRIERGRIGVQGEVSRLAEVPRGPAVDQPVTPGMVGMRGGIVRGDGDGGMAAWDLPADWRPAVGQTVHAAGGSHAKSTTETLLSAGTLIVSAEPARAGGVAWAGYVVPPPAWLRTWQIIVVALALATALLVSSAVASVITVTRGAAALNTALDGLATDLGTPVPRPPLRELSDVAEGIARLAHRLARSREIQAEMGRQLAMKDRLAALGRVVAGVAHEVRNPLASIKLRLDLAAGGDAALPTAVEEAIAHASGEIARLDRLVADLLVVASPGIGPRRRTAIGPLIQARMVSLAPWCDVRRVQVRVSGDATASVDADAVARAVDNLLRNAVEASPPGGAVDVVVSEDRDMVSMVVEDRGPGVPQPRTQELFEPFFTTKPDGTGLGLAICRSIARAHGGDVTFARVDGATRVELTVSRVESARDDVPARDAAAATAGVAAETGAA